MEHVQAASAVVVDARRRIVLVQRGTAPQRGRWSVPGGRREPGETLEQTAARETFEETGLRIAVGRKLWSLTVPTGDGRLYEIHDFVGTVTGGTLSAGDDAADARWVDADELETLELTTDLMQYLIAADVLDLPAPTFDG